MTALTEQMFGKKFSELTADEKREYYRVQKKRNRMLNPKLAERERAYYEKYCKENADKIAEYRKKYKERLIANRVPHKRKHCTTSLIYELFGEITFKELSLEQKRKYYCEKQKRYMRRNFGLKMAEIEKCEDFVENK